MIPGFDWICAGLRRGSMPPIGSPGISLGSRNVIVSATQVAKT